MIDPDTIEAAYPDSHLRCAAFASDPSVGLDAAIRWIGSVDWNDVTYLQHPLIVRLTSRYQMELSGHPLMPRLLAVQKQFWIRGRANAAFSNKALDAINAASSRACLVGAAGWYGRPGIVADSLLDTIDILSPQDEMRRVCELLEWGGLILAPSQESYRGTASTLWFHSKQQLRVRLMTPGGLRWIGVKAFDRVANAKAEGPLALRAAPFGLMRKVMWSQSLANHPVPDQWLFDLAMFQEAGLATTPAHPEIQTHIAESQVLFAEMGIRLQ